MFHRPLRPVKIAGKETPNDFSAFWVEKRGRMRLFHKDDARIALP